jgi:hypothetical protein
MLLLMLRSHCVAMKLLMLLGGALGFGIGLFCSRIQENSWPYCLWHASLAAYAGGWLMGWWGRAWQQSLRDSALERATRSAAALATPSVSKPSKS